MAVLEKSSGGGTGVVVKPRPANRTLLRIRFALRQLQQNPLAFIGTLVVLAFFLMATIGPFLAPYGFAEQSAALRQPPSAAHFFGTDNFGRDVFSRIVWGSRDIVSLAGLGTLLAVIVGTALGLAVSYVGGWVDEVTMRLLDSVLALPAGMLALLLMGAVGPSRQNVLIVLVIVYVPIVARVVRSVVLDIKTRGFVEAALMRAENPLYIMTREILPGVIPALVVEASLRFSYAIFLVATLGYLGAGVQPPDPDWGLMVQEGAKFRFTAPWMLFFPCAAIAVLIVGVNLMSDGLKQILQTSIARD